MSDEPKSLETATGPELEHAGERFEAMLSAASETGLDRHQHRTEPGAGHGVDR